MLAGTAFRQNLAITHSVIHEVSEEWWSSNNSCCMCITLRSLNRELSRYFRWEARLSWDSKDSEFFSDDLELQASATPAGFEPVMNFQPFKNVGAPILEMNG